MALTTALRHGLLSTALLGAALTLTGCSTEPGSDEVDGPEPVGTLEAAQGGSVENAMATSCSTLSVKGLSLQIIAEGNCITPGAYATVPSRPNVSFGAPVFRVLEKPARDKLVASLDAHPSWNMTVNSMLRTVAQQYLLYRWYKTGRCSIPLAATPGNSNHETGLAMDISPYSTWKGSLQNHGFKWFGASDTAHFDYVGAGAVNHKGLDVKAFQRLWNRNNPSDKITVDGDYGPQTEARLKKSPAGGFAQGAVCASANSFDEGCAHSLSQPGEALDGFCSGCAFQVCTQNVACCTSGWTKECVNAASKICPAELEESNDTSTLSPDAEEGLETGVLESLDEDEGEGEHDHGAEQP